MFDKYIMKQDKLARTNIWPVQAKNSNQIAPVENSNFNFKNLKINMTPGYDAHLKRLQLLYIAKALVALLHISR